MRKLVLPLAVLTAAAFATPTLACEYMNKSAKAPQKTVMQTPAPAKPTIPETPKSEKKS